MQLYNINIIQGSMQKGTRKNQTLQRVIHKRETSNIKEHYMRHNIKAVYDSS